MRKESPISADWYSRPCMPKVRSTRRFDGASAPSFTSLSGHSPAAPTEEISMLAAHVEAIVSTAERTAAEE